MLEGRWVKNSVISLCFKKVFFFAGGKGRASWEFYRAIHSDFYSFLSNKVAFIYLMCFNLHRITRNVFWKRDTRKEPLRKRPRHFTLSCNKYANLPCLTSLSRHHTWSRAKLFFYLFRNEMRTQMHWENLRSRSSLSRYVAFSLYL